MNPALVPPLMTAPVRSQLSLLFKIAGITFLMGVLHIPLLMTEGVLRERKGYREQATREIAATWGQKQLVTGPVLAVPYVYHTSGLRSKLVEGKVVQVEEAGQVAAVAYFLPETLRLDGRVDPEVRHRGIYDAVVYTAKLTFAGSFQPDFAAAGLTAERIIWGKAQVLFGVADLRGVRVISDLVINGGPPRAFEAAEGLGGEGLSLAAKAEGAAAGTKLDYRFEVSLQGSERIDLAPLGKVTQATLSSPWADPSFGGAYLPSKRNVGTNGFAAEWETSHFSRGFGQSWTDRTTAIGEMTKKFSAASFGVAFTQPLDGYRLVERAKKYGVLFFVLVFAVFFLFEVTAGLHIHPLQYALVGAGLCLFFLTFLALSEFWSPGLAYGVAAVACTALVSLYARSFLRTGGRTLVIAGGLGVTYGCLHFVLKSQDYALVAGVVALFAALSLMMFCTRRINWYDLERSRTPDPRGQ